MRIGIMLRAYDRPGGIGIYSRNIVKHLLNMDRDNHYILVYNNKAHLGTHRDIENVDEVFVPPSNPMIWDQWIVPKVMKKWGADLIFNTKFSVPLLTKAKKIMVLHGASWFVHPELYGKFDILYVRQAMPIYCRKADFLISNSDLTTRDFVSLIGVPETKIATVRLAAGDEFHPISDSQILENVRTKYRLPGRFILTVTSYDPRKNFSILLKAFEQCRNKAEVHLVVVGKDCNRYATDFDLKGRGLENVVHFPGWIAQEDLPAIYSLADVFAFPSVYEEFGIPVVEAMSCGCPVVSSNTGAIPELTSDAALLSHPLNYQALAEHLLQILMSNQAAERCRELGLERAKEFSWSKAARQTLNIFQKINAQRGAWNQQ